MAGDSVFVGMVTLWGVVGLLFISLTFISKGHRLFLQGMRKRFWCEKKQKAVDVDFMAVNPNKDDVAACTAFSADDTISCDKHCMNPVEERSDWGLKGGPGRERTRKRFRGFNWRARLETAT